MMVECKISLFHLFIRIMFMGMVKAQMCQPNKFLGVVVWQSGWYSDNHYGCDDNDYGAHSNIPFSENMGNVLLTDAERCFCECFDRQSVLNRCIQENKYLIECGGEINYVCRSCPAGNS